MPKTSEFKKQKSKKKKIEAIPEVDTHEESRRPGLESQVLADSATVDNKGDEISENVPPIEDPKILDKTQEEVSAQFQDEMQDESEEKTPFRLSFLGSELVREKLPKTFELAEKLTDEWMHDGAFDDLPINQPLAQYYVGAGLRKAKEKEKMIKQKIEQSNVMPLMKMVAEAALAKIFKK